METQQSAKEHQTESQTQIKAKGCSIIASQKSGDAKSKKKQKQIQKEQETMQKKFPKNRKNLKQLFSLEIKFEIQHLQRNQLSLKQIKKDGLMMIRFKQDGHKYCKKI